MQKDSMKDMRSRNLRNIAFITILVIVALLVLQTWHGTTTTEKEASYSDFRTLVERGQPLSSKGTKSRPSFWART